VVLDSLLRHYTGKHGILELYLREALAEKGIQYHMSDSAKRKSMGTEIGRRAAKEARLDNDVNHVETILPDSLTSPAMHQLHQDSIVADTTTPTNTHLNTSTHLNIPPPTISTYKLPSVSTVLPSVSTVLPSVTTVLPSMSTVLPSVSSVLTRPTPDQIKREVEAMMASLEPCDTQVVFTLPQISISQPIEDLNLDGCQVSSTTPDCLLPMPDNTMKVVLNDPGIMWGGGGGPSVLVESAQTVPVQYIEDSGFVNLGDIDYDYLYPATLSTPQPSPSSSSSQERQLPFSMM